jgi:ferredoxin
MGLVRHLILVFLIAWLPVQGWTAVAMPFCKHALGHSSAAQTAGDHHEHHLQTAAAQHQHHQHHGDDTPAKAGHGLICDDCGACHLACSSSLLPGAIAVAVPAILRDYRLPPPASLYLFYPEQPSRPPLNAIT